MVGAPIKTQTPPTPPAQKPRPASPQRESGSNGKRAGRPTLVVRIVLTIFIIWHFSGVFLAALSIGDTSELVMNLAQKPPMQWYLDATFMNQGHSFFAPDVGPGHVIRYELFDQSNQPIERGELPSRKEHWPRLLYHRYFMLADQADAAGPDKQTRDLWQGKFLDAYGRQLLRAHPEAQVVRLRRFAHWPLPGFYATQGIRRVKDEVQQLKSQSRSAEASELEANLVQEGLERGYVIFRPDFQRETQNRQIDEQGFEFLGESVQRRSNVDPEAARQTMNWRNNRPNTAQRWTGVPR